jgi:hypothetical protein
LTEGFIQFHFTVQRNRKHSVENLVRDVLEMGCPRLKGKELVLLPPDFVEFNSMLDRLDSLFQHDATAFVQHPHAT